MAEAFSCIGSCAPCQLHLSEHQFVHPGQAVDGVHPDSISTIVLAPAFVLLPNLQSGMDVTRLLVLNL